MKKEKYLNFVKRTRGRVTVAPEIVWVRGFPLFVLRERERERESERERERERAREKEREKERERVILR
jgi:hypothetical protein